MLPSWYLTFLAIRVINVGGNSNQFSDRKNAIGGLIVYYSGSKCALNQCVNIWDFSFTGCI